MDFTGFDDRSQHRFGQRNGNGKTDSSAGAGSRQDRGVDPDQLATQIHQGAAGVARVDGGIGLQKVLEPVSVGDDVLNTILAADDSGGHGLVETKGAADRQYPVTDLDFVRATQRCGTQTGQVDFDDRQVGLRIGADNRARHFSAIE